MTGVRIIERALEEPIRQICANAAVDGSIVIRDIKSSDNEHFGYNARTGQYQDLVKNGVIDPKKVTRVALQNAASVASMVLMTECALVNIPEKQNNNTPIVPEYGM